jgi:tellurite resistance protein
MKLVRNALMMAKSSGEVTDEERREIESIAKELRKDIGARLKLFG